MVKTEKWKVFNFEGAIRGMRTSLDHYDGTDSFVEYILDTLNGTNTDGKPAEIKITNENFVFGENDLNLAKDLIKSGPSYRKFLNQILVSVDVTGPLYWLRELDSYTKGTDSGNLVDIIYKYPITKELFSTDGMSEASIKIMENYLKQIEKLRKKFLDEGKSNKQILREITCMIPESWNQKKTYVFSYETLLNIAKDKENNKSIEWTSFIAQAKESCPYFDELIVSYINYEKDNHMKISRYDEMVDNISLYVAAYGALSEEQKEEARKKLDELEAARRQSETPISNTNKPVVAVRSII